MRPVTLLLTLSAVACVPQDTFKHPASTVPADLGDGWIISTLAAENMNEALFDEATRMFFDDDQCINALALLVVRHGKLVFETYPHDPADRERLHHVQSVTKPVVSLTFGTVRAQGHFPDLDATVSSFMPEAFANHPDKQAITLRHLLTYRSGINLADSDFVDEVWGDRLDDPLEYILARPMSAPPGQQHDYKCCDPHLLSITVRRVTGRNGEEWAAEQLFTPIGISRWSWAKDSTGTTMGGSGFCATARDLARLGLLVVRRGAWGATQVIPQAWIEESTSHQVDIHWPGHDAGYLWPLVPPLGAVRAEGHGGNFIVIVPGKDLVVVLVSTPYAAFLPPIDDLAQLIVSSCQ
jgi:CubicO group peptidase (beta-lactamase class C family)